MRHAVRGVLCAVGAAAILAACDAAPPTGPAMRPEFSKNAPGAPTQLSVPTGIHASISDTTLTITWSAVSGAVSYNVVFEVPAGGVPVAAAPNTTGTVLTRSIAGISDLAGYCVKVRADAPTGQDANGTSNSDFSDCVPLLGIESCVAVSWDVEPGNGDAVDPLDLTAPTSAEIPVAVYGSATFDVTKLDVATLTMGDNSGTDTNVDKHNNGTWFYSYEDVNGDGFTDLAVKFSQSALIANGDLGPLTTELYLNGFYDGTALCTTGDAVRIVPAP